MKNSDLFDESRKHPILLPKDHKISMLITKQSHGDLYHPGVMRVVSEVRKKYWVIEVRTLAKKIGKKCIVTPGYPFENTSVDYFGPFYVKYGRRQRIKAYGAIFTCLTTRAIHLELVTDLTADRFLQTLRRFMSLWTTENYP